MRIAQGKLSKGVYDFPFLKIMGLSGYVDSEAPCVFFGCYTEDDVHNIRNHNGKKIIFWCGQDSLDCIFYGRYRYLKDCIHVTHLNNVFKALTPFLPVTLVDPILIGGTFTPSILGNKIFAYAPGESVYHNMEMITYLKSVVAFEFIIGNGSIPQNEWLAGQGDSVYDECFIGLCLSGYAGGGQTIIQLGLKGRKVVNNVLTLPNCISWENVKDVVNAINSEAIKIGAINYELAEETNRAIDYKHDWLELKS